MNTSEYFSFYYLFIYIIIIIKPYFLFHNTGAESGMTEVEEIAIVKYTRYIQRDIGAVVQIWLQCEWWRVF